MKARGNVNDLSHVPSNRKEEIQSGTSGCGLFVVPYFQPATSTDRLHNNRLSMTPHLVRSQNAYKNVTIDSFHRDTWVSVHSCLTLRGSHLGNREGSGMMSYMCMCNFYIGVLFDLVIRVDAYLYTAL